MKLRIGVKVTPLKREKAIVEEVGYYNMKGFPHGLAVIINVGHFQMHEDRTGTEIDEEMLVTTFRYLGYKVEVHRDCTAVDMCVILEDIQRQDHSKYDSFVCCILSHGGDSDKIYGRNSEYNPLDSLANRLIASKCSSLAGKPKMFFVQTCRGVKTVLETPHAPKSTDGATTPTATQCHPKDDTDATDGILTQSSTTEVDGPMGSSSAFNLPSIADFYFSFATSPGYVANRDFTEGSWFMQALCKVFCKHGTYLSLDSMMKVVGLAMNSKHRGRQASWTSGNSMKDVFFF